MTMVRWSRSSLRVAIGATGANYPIELSIAVIVALGFVATGVTRSVATPMSDGEPEDLSVTQTRG
jgi:hypothetical protein